MSEDPFFAVKDEVEISLSNANQLYTNWKRLTSATSPVSAPGRGTNPSSADAEELRWTTEELTVSVQTIEQDLQDLDETIRIVESNPAKFRLDIREIAQRKEFIAKTRRTLADMKTTIARRRAVSASPNLTSNINASSSASNGLPAPTKRGHSDRDLLLGSKKGGFSAADRFGRTEEDYKASNQRFIERESQMQEQIMRDQDNQLDDVLDTVGNLKEVAVVMNRELEDQTALLEDLEERVDNTDSNLKMGMKRMQDFIKANAVFSL
ncbi:Syntaxin-6 [Chytridiales sp. JEL 0842]|nr:Syntaxin-6 [Chytridiales sp. JEL 0842]